MGRRELENIVTKTKFSFHTLHEGDTIVDTDTRSGMMVMLTDGTAVATTFSDDKGYRVEEEINGPMLVQPEYVFGLAQHFSQLWKAKTVCHLITLDKQEILAQRQLAHLSPQSPEPTLHAGAKAAGTLLACSLAHRRGVPPPVLSGTFDTPGRQKGCPHQDLKIGKGTEH